MSQGALRPLAKGLLVLGLVLASAIGVGVGSAQASTSHYCNPCGIPQNQAVYETTKRRLQSNYVHYLGTGTRHLGAGIYRPDTSAMTVWGTNEVLGVFAYSPNWDWGQAFVQQNPNYTQYSIVTVNAHSNYYG